MILILRLRVLRSVVLPETTPGLLVFGNAARGDLSITLNMFFIVLRDGLFIPSLAIIAFFLEFLALANGILSLDLDSLSGFSVLY